VGISEGIMSEIIDQIARDAANRALNAIEVHERVCEERAKAGQIWHEATSAQIEDMADNLKTRMEKLNKSVDGIYNRIWTTASGLILFLLGCIGYLIEHHGL
jgi:hypothetical protein